MVIEQKESPEAYEAYLKLTSIICGYSRFADFKEEIKPEDIEGCADKAILISKNLYGEESEETAEAYRLKALCMIGNNNDDRLKLLKMALLITIKIEGNKGSKAKKIFLNIKDTWAGEDKLKNPIIWTCNNITKEFIMDAAEEYPKSIREDIISIIKQIQVNEVKM